jgi:hypothetical protein
VGGGSLASSRLILSGHTGRSSGLCTNGRLVRRSRERPTVKCIGWVAVLVCPLNPVQITIDQRANKRLRVFFSGPEEAGEETWLDKGEAREDCNVYRGSRRSPPDQLDDDEEVHTRPASDTTRPLPPPGGLLWKPTFRRPEPLLPSYG